MSGIVQSLFTDDLPMSNAPSDTVNGILPYQTIKELIRQGEIQSDEPIIQDQLQPASLDLRLGDVAYRVRASFMPGPYISVQDKISQLSTHEIDLTRGAVLEKGCVYIVPLLESLKLSPRLSALANPKSSIGRLDVFTRLVTDRCKAFDRVESAHQGRLYAEIVPKTFSIVVRRGSRLNQLRLMRGSPITRGNQLKRLHTDVGLVDNSDPTFREDSIGVSLDLVGDPKRGLVGYRAKRHSDVIDIDRRAHYEVLDFWEPIHSRKGRGLVLNPDDFYILATKERVTVPPDHAAEMIAYDTLVGEFRVHYAGFFDPGFGYDPVRRSGTKAVLEVRSHEVPFMLEHEQLIGWLRYEKLAGRSDRLYGPQIGSSYQDQGLALSKHFRPFVE